jgi:hypothetical protein
MRAVETARLQPQQSVTIVCNWHEVCSTEGRRLFDYNFAPGVPRLTPSSDYGSQANE